MPFQKSARLTPWVYAIRPRTLPLALASIIMAMLLAAADHAFNGPVVALAALTAIFLQILSNLANDYGDYTHGADHTGRQGPVRVMVSGQVSERAMQVAIGMVALLAMVTGLALVLVAMGTHAPQTLMFLLIGGGAVGAALTYTLGQRPYGYAGLGDLAVFTFFGWVGVIGTYYLQAHRFDWSLFLPATSCGLLAVGVLNVNNIRDIESDQKAGKRSIPARLGLPRAYRYHWGLLMAAMGTALAYTMLTGAHAPQFLFMITLPLVWLHGRAVNSARSPQELNAQLKQLAQTTLLFVLTFGTGQML